MYKNRLTEKMPKPDYGEFRNENCCDDEEGFDILHATRKGNLKSAAVINRKLKCIVEEAHTIADWLKEHARDTFDKGLYEITDKCLSSITDVHNWQGWRIDHPDCIGYAVKRAYCRDQLLELNYLKKLCQWRMQTEDDIRTRKAEDKFGSERLDPYFDAAYYELQEIQAKRKGEI